MMNKILICILIFLNFLFSFSAYTQLIQPDTIVTDSYLTGFPVKNLFDGDFKTSWRTEEISHVTVFFNQTKEIKKIIFYLGDSLKANEFTKPFQIYVHFYHLEKENPSNPYEYVDQTVPFRFHKNHGLVEMILKEPIPADEICFSFDKMFKGKSPILEIHEIIIKGEDDWEEDT